MILLDTSVLSLAFRRRRSRDLEEPAAVRALRVLVEDGEDLRIPGIVFQEVVSGLKTESQFTLLEEALAGFPLVLADRADHQSAARLSNQCRWAGIAATTIDCLIAAQAVRRGASLLTTDRDFTAIKKLAQLRLHPVLDDSL